MLSKKNIVATTYPYHKLSLEYTLNSLERVHAKDIEFVCCEPHFYFDDVKEGQAEQLKKDLEKHGLNMVVLTPPTMEYPMNLASDHYGLRTKTINYIVKAIEYAHFFGAKVVTFSAGQVDYDKEVGPFWTRSVEAVQYLCDVADAYGVKLAVYVTDSKASCIINSLETAKKFMKDVNKPALNFVADTLYLAKANVSLKSFFEAVENRVPVVHFADFVSGNTHMAPGEGKLDLEASIKELNEIGFDGYLSLNMRGSRDPYKYEEEPERCMGNGLSWLEAHLG